MKSGMPYRSSRSTAGMWFMPPVPNTRSGCMATIFSSEGLKGAPIVGFFAKNYIAGEAIGDAVRVTRELNRQGMMATIDVLGEFIRTKEDARDFKEQCLLALDTIRKEGLDANLSLKPTQMGLLLDKETAFANIREIVAHARDLGNFVRIDMEDISCTDATLDFYRRLREEFPGHVGVALQA